MPDPVGQSNAASAVAAAIAAQKHRPGALLPILHEIQDNLGYVPKEAVPVIAKALNLSRAEVHGVITFYHHFRSSSPGKHVVRICRAEACQSMGAERLIEHVQTSLKTEMHETSADGRFTIEPVYCLGNCACSPAVMIDDQLHGRVDANKFDDILKNLKETA
ncbi:MAG: formate dehydrogenase subunit gamma [Gammaproteobacteria bacterium]|nr:formate dehydrogenase subunit gamma [Gammaproteobacteria bacterium]